MNKRPGVPTRRHASTRMHERTRGTAISPLSRALSLARSRSRSRPLAVCSGGHDSALPPSRRPSHIHPGHVKSSSAPPPPSFSFFSSSASPDPAAMSPTAVLTMMTTAAPPPQPTTTATATTCCPNCGLGLPPLAPAQAELLAAQARIQEPESQVRQLNHKASVAVERWAAYEAELSRLRAASPSPSPVAASPSPASSSRLSQLDPASASAQSPVRSSFFQSAPSRLSALLYPRKSAASLRPESSSTPTPTPPPPLSAASTTSSTSDLLEALTREQHLRREAEGRLSATSKEVEELSASLFEQANEMVADERRARARLEQRVGELEKRDVDKRRRLERLEVAMERIEKARDLLAK